jgi:hypothetical protein
LCQSNMDKMKPHREYVVALQLERNIVPGERDNFPNGVVCHSPVPAQLHVSALGHYAPMSSSLENCLHTRKTNNLVHTGKRMAYAAHVATMTLDEAEDPTEHLQGLPTKRRLKQTTKILKSKAQTWTLLDVNVHNDGKARGENGFQKPNVTNERDAMEALCLSSKLGGICFLVFGNAPWDRLVELLQCKTKLAGEYRNKIGILQVSPQIKYGQDKNAIAHVALVHTPGEGEPVLKVFAKIQHPSYLKMAKCSKFFTTLQVDGIALFRETMCGPETEANRKIFREKMAGLSGIATMGNKEEEEAEVKVDAHPLEGEGAECFNRLVLRIGLDPVEFLRRLGQKKEAVEKAAKCRRGPAVGWRTFYSLSKNFKLFLMTFTYHTENLRIQNTYHIISIITLLKHSIKIEMIAIF